MPPSPQVSVTAAQKQRQVPLTRAIWSHSGSCVKPGIALTKLTKRLTHDSMLGMKKFSRISRRPSTSMPVTSNTLLYSSPVRGFIGPKICCFSAFCSYTASISLSSHRKHSATVVTTYVNHINNCKFTILQMYTLSQKSHSTLIHNLYKFWPIFKILSLSHSP